MGAALFGDRMVVALTLLVLYLSGSDAEGEGGGSQTCVSTFAQATCMGPWFGWNEPSHLSQRKHLNSAVAYSELTCLFQLA